jgi:hypothetical protein
MHERGIAPFAERIDMNIYDRRLEEDYRGIPFPLNI